MDKSEEDQAKKRLEQLRIKAEQERAEEQSKPEKEVEAEEARKAFRKNMGCGG